MLNNAHVLIMKNRVAKMKIFTILMDAKSWLSEIYLSIKTKYWESKKMKKYSEYFEKSFNYAMLNEGGYGYCKDDLGGETFMGISRYYNPSWKGWEILDGLSVADKRNSDNEEYKLLVPQVKKFYYEKYWLGMNGDEIMDLQVAIKLFDMVISLGLRRTTEYLQEILFVLKNDIKIDGLFGPMTLKILNNTIKQKITKNRLIMCLCTYHSNHYINLCLAKPDQRIFINGWIDRANKKPEG
jgi:lysozyme family protein